MTPGEARADEVDGLAEAQRVAERAPINEHNKLIYKTTAKTQTQIGNKIAERAPNVAARPRRKRSTLLDTASSARPMSA